MAEGFAKLYGKDVMEVESAGVMPASGIPEVTRRVMREKNIELIDHFPKPYEELAHHDLEIVVNMSGYPLKNDAQRELRTWPVKDPIGHDDSVHRAVRDEIERRVMGLILELRTKPGRN